MLMKIAKDIALAEITLRKYEKPYNMPKRELVRRICLSLGLLQPGDSRDIIVDILSLLFENKPPEGKNLPAPDIREQVIVRRKKLDLPVFGIAHSNIRRQLKRLKQIYLIEKINGGYRITENCPVSEIFKERIEGFYLKSIISRIKEYLLALEEGGQSGEQLNKK